jgi:UDP-N-acetylglucosamine 1-carboxyvinyltransferase
MDRIVIRGGRPLYGVVKIAGAKNAMLPLMAASLLTKEVVTLENVPNLSDVVTMSSLLANHGVKIDMITHDDDSTPDSMSLKAEEIVNFRAPYDIVRKMRASVLVLGPLLARFGHASVSLPGGCAIGLRPVNMHLDGLSQLGAEIHLRDGYIEAKVKDRLRGCEIRLESASVGATENILMAATLADGKTVIYNAAREPEVVDLAMLLNSMGACIRGSGTGTIVIQGVGQLRGARHRIMPDRLEAGTYAVAALITGGELILDNVYDHGVFSGLAEYIRQAGGIVKELDYRRIFVQSNGHTNAMNIETGVYPGFPTDMQAQFMSLLAVSSGMSLIKENIFENRFMHVLELNRMGANISVSGHTATVIGVDKLYGAEIMATDLRASVSLVLAGLVAQGRTVINRVYHIDRGYEKIEAKLRQCGAQIERIT